MLTFIIPVRHPDNSNNWGKLKARLSQTMRSISNQSSSRWRAIIVANRHADLPPLPRGFQVEPVDFPPNPKYDRRAAGDVGTLHNYVRVDKGRRIAAGMLSAERATFFMTVDDDDFVSSQLAGYVSQHPDENGWYFDHGYLWSEGSIVLAPIRRFFMVCGTSHIVKASLYDFQEIAKSRDSENAYTSQMLGSHIFITETLASSRNPLSSLPFFGAIYRVGHSGSHSRSGGLLATSVLNRKTLANPAKAVNSLFSLKLLTPNVRREFFG
jgi:hypothetical protein